MCPICGGLGPEACGGLGPEAFTVSWQGNVEQLAGKDTEIARLEARNLENAATLQVAVPHHQL